MNVSLLRRALRLVHCLQKERGASCAMCASPSTEFQQAMQNARELTDCATLRLYKQMPPSLAKIRQQLDGRTTSQVHRMLDIFNTLISNVVHEYILKYLKKSRELRHKRGYHHRRSASLDNIQQNQHRYQSDNLVPEFMLPHANVHTPPRMEFLKPMSDPALFYDYVSRCSSPPAAWRSVQSSYPGRTKHVSHNFLDTTQDRTEALLNLLGCLVRLKESTGMQRAVISSFTEDSLSLLVLEVENQRKLMAELQQLPLFDYSLQKLVQDSIRRNPQMESLHSKILKDFELRELHKEMDSNDIWNMITVYIDKLHALELLLVEELEYCVEDETIITNHVPTSQLLFEAQDVLQDIFGDNRIVDMPAETIKQKLVDYMRMEQQTTTHEEAPPPPPPPILSENHSLLQLPTADSTSKEWNINLDELQFKKRIGRGTAGTTYMAKWSGQTVAVKVAAITEMGLDGWKTEVQALQRLHHPNVIRLLGSVCNANPLTYCLVLEFCDAGDLSSAMQLVTPRNFVFRVATDIANGMAYLHRRGVLHRDIKPSNVLLDGNVTNGSFSAKVSDFGVATTFDNELSNRTAETGTYRWMAPEIIRHEPYSLEADVYSFAILCWQLLTREDPFHNVSPLEAAGKVALELARPPFPKGTPVDFQELIRTCWTEDPCRRLSFVEISTRLVELETSLSVDETTWLQAPMGHAVYQTPTTQSSTISRLPYLKVPSPPKPPLDANHHHKLQEEKRSGGLRSIFAKHHKKQGHLH